MIRLFTILFSAVVISACGGKSNSDESQIDSNLLHGTWQIEKEIFENHTLDCKDNPIKSKLNLESNGYFLIYEDLSQVNKNGAMPSMQTSIKGQYSIHSDTLILSYSEGSAEIEERFHVESINNENLTLENITSHKLIYYSKK